MQRFASRDLMVSSLPEQEEWAVAWDCGDCTNGTDNSDKPTETSASDRDFPALQAQLRASAQGKRRSAG